MLCVSKRARYLLSMVVLLGSVPAHAWDGVNQGVPGLIEVTHGENYGFRVHLANVTAMCGPSTPSWIYLQSTDSNYSTYVAAILMAKAQGTTVQLYGTLDSSGYCHLGHLAMTG